MSLAVRSSTRKARRRRSPSDTTSGPLRVRCSAWTGTTRLHWQLRHQCTVEPGRALHHVTVRGSVLALGANTVLLNGITVNGSVWLFGGGGPIPWSIKNDTIGHDLTVVGVTADWFGALFNQIGGSATLIKITANNPATDAHRLRRSATPSGGTLTARDWAHTCREASSPERSTPSATKQPGNAIPGLSPH